MAKKNTLTILSSTSQFGFYLPTSSTTTVVLQPTTPKRRKSAKPTKSSKP